jgi:hypothetical protein
MELGLGEGFAFQTGGGSHLATLQMEKVLCNTQ